MNVFSHSTLQSLFDAARQVFEAGASSEILREPLEELKKLVHFRDSEIGQELIDRARDCYSSNSDDIEIDNNPIIDYNGEGGYWVMSWCYIEQSDRDCTAFVGSQVELAPYVVGNPR